MKKLFFILAVYCFSCGPLFAQSRYDVNWDGVIDMTDYNLVWDYIYGKYPDVPERFSAFDINRDYVVNIADVTNFIGYFNNQVKNDTLYTIEYGVRMWPCSRPRWNNVGSAYSDQMTIYITEESMPQAPYFYMTENDQMAVYIGDECRCVAKPLKTLDGYLRFSAQVISKKTDPNPTYCQIRYYSDDRHGMFYSEPIRFVSGDTRGTKDSGYTFNWLPFEY